MAHGSMTNTGTLPGIVTDQPEIYESERPHSVDTGVNDLDLDSHIDDAVGLIEIPTRQAFSYFAERENEIAKFYVQRLGEYKISNSKPDEETDIEKYHRLVSEVSQLLSKFQSDKEARKEDQVFSVTTNALTTNLEILSRQLKSLEFAAQDGSLNPTQAGFLEIKSKLDKLKEKVSQNNEDPSTEVLESKMTVDDSSKLIRMSALERRLNTLENSLGKDDKCLQELLKATRSDNLLGAAERIGTWLSLFQHDNVQQLNSELDYMVQRMEKLKDQTTSNNDQSSKIDADSKSKLSQLYNLVTMTDKQRSIVPIILHRLNAMEELQNKASTIATTVNHLEQVQSQISDNLQANKVELSSLTEMFSKNIELIKQFSQDIDNRITAIRERSQ